MMGNDFEGLCAICDVDIDDIDFVDENTTNVYRTEEFIVSQNIHFYSDGFGHTRLVSEDTYYFRTKFRDMLYEKLFDDNGKRMRSAMFVRTYIE